MLSIPESLQTRSHTCNHIQQPLTLPSHDKEVEEEGSISGLSLSLVLMSLSDFDTSEFLDSDSDDTYCIPYCTYIYLPTYLVYLPSPQWFILHPSRFLSSWLGILLPKFSLTSSMHVRTTLWREILQMTRGWPKFWVVYRIYYLRIGTVPIELTLLHYLGLSLLRRSNPNSYLQPG